MVDQVMALQADKFSQKTEVQMNSFENIGVTKAITFKRESDHF